MSRVVVVGGINMDLHLFGGRRWSSGATLVVDHYVTEPGGKGSNVARAAARLGAEVRLVARVGDDEFGHRCVAAIAADGVDVGAVSFSSTTPTGFVAIELNQGLHRTLVYAPGANDELTWEHVEPTLRDLARGEIVIAQAEVPGATIAMVAGYCSANGAQFYLDPAPPEDVDPAVLRIADVVTPDRAEAAALVGRADTSEVWPAIAAEELHRAGPRTVVVKTGATGAVLVDGWGTRQIPTLAIEPENETGAGDVFMAALAVRRAEGAGWDDAVRFANAASALSVAHASLLLPDRDAVEAALAAAG
jgi:ribokinase